MQYYKLISVTFFSCKNTTVSPCTEISYVQPFLVETTNDMPFPLPDTKYDKPF